MPTPPDLTATPAVPGAVIGREGGVEAEPRVGVGDTEAVGPTTSCRGDGMRS